MKLLDGLAQEQFKKRSKQPFSHLKGIRLATQIKNLEQTAEKEREQNAGPEYEHRLEEEDEDDPSVSISDSSDDTVAEDDGKNVRGPAVGTLKKSHVDKESKNSVPEVLKIMKVTSLTLQDVLNGASEKIPDSTDLVTRWERNLEHLYVYGDGDDPVSKDMFCELLNGALHHHIVEACMYAIEREYGIYAGNCGILSVFDWKEITKADFKEDAEISLQLEKNKVIIPAVISDHWFLVIVLWDQKKFQYVGADDIRATRAHELFMDYVRGVQTDVTDTALEVEPLDGILQEDEKSCGVYMLHYYKKILKKESLSEPADVVDIRRELAELCLKARSLCPRISDKMSTSKFPNGLFTCVDYYVTEKESPEYVTCVPSRNEIQHCLGTDFRLLVRRSKLTTRMVDIALTSFSMQYPNDNYLILTTSESTQLLRRRFTRSLQEANIDPADRTLLMPLEMASAKWTIVIANLSLKFFFSVSEDEETNSATLFQNFQGFAQHRYGQTIAAAKGEIKKWSFVPPTSLGDLRGRRWCDSSLHVLHILLNILGVKLPPCSSIDEHFQMYVSHVVLKYACDMRPRCTVCAKDQYKKYNITTDDGKKKKQLADMVECEWCLRWVHKVDCIQKITGGDTFGEEPCFLCANWIKNGGKKQSSQSYMNLYKDMTTTTHFTTAEQLLLSSIRKELTEEQALMVGVDTTRPKFVEMGRSVAAEIMCPICDVSFRLFRTNNKWNFTKYVHHIRTSHYKSLVR